MGSTRLERDKISSHILNYFTKGTYLYFSSFEDF